MDSLWLMTFLLGARICNSGRILVINPSSARSHALILEPLIEELASRGHNLTVFTCYKQELAFPNLQQIDLSTLFPKLLSKFSFEMIKETMPNPFQTPIFMIDIDHSMCEKIYSYPPTQDVLKSEENFDLVISETFSADCYYPFAHKFKAPFVSVVTSSALPWVADRVGLPDNPSYIPNYLTDFSPEMSLYERLYNSVNLVYSKLLHYYYALPRTRRIVTKYFENSLPEMDYLLRNKTSLMMVNSHISLSNSRPFPPNVVEIGGIHIKKSSHSLPKDLQDILDNSSQGVILMSFGSLVRTSTIPHHIIRMFMNVFSTIPQTVIFKYEDDLPNVPHNVVIRSWLPQQQIIEHKNVKMLLAHGGLASTIEAVYFSKPFLGMPFFADQYLNIKAIVRRGAGLMLDFDSLSEEKIETAVKEILTNPAYSENMNRLSYEFRDRPMTPLQTAVYWIEYVIRHQGAPHLRPASVNLPLYKYLLLDVVAILFLPLLLVIYLVYFLFFRAVKINPNDYRKYKFKKR